MAKRMTVKRMIEIENTSSDRGVRFAINFARNQWGNRIAKQVATLIGAGHEVAIFQSPDCLHDGILLDGTWIKWDAINSEGVPHACADCVNVHGDKASDWLAKWPEGAEWREGHGTWLCDGCADERDEWARVEGSSS